MPGSTDRGPPASPRTGESSVAGTESNPAALAPAVVARELLDATRHDDPAEPYLARLADVTDAELTRVRETRAVALAFWTNLYNAGTQLLLQNRPELYESRLRFLRFFSAPCVTVAGQDLSLDDIEQGILRGRSKYGLGYIPRLLSSRFERRYRVTEPDPRVHFALNCGAASCPPIRFYEADRIDDQLDTATRGYLDATVEYDAKSGVVRVPRVFLWYRGDFGGRSGIRTFLQGYEIIPSHATPKVRYRSWDWSKTAAKFVD